MSNTPLSIEVIAIEGGVWNTIPVTQQPSLTLRNWSVRQLHDGDRHFVGYCIENGEGRVSSKIVSFDPVTMRGVTDTGRVYGLQGPPGMNADAEFVWVHWMRRYRLSEYINVSAELTPPNPTTLAAIQDAKDGNVSPSSLEDL